MPSSDRAFYKERVEINVQKDFVLFGKKYKNKEFMEEAQRYLESVGEQPERSEHCSFREKLAMIRRILFSQWF